MTKIIREITVAARDGGPDPAMNPRLRLALDKARLGNMPKDKLERAIKRGAGELEGANYEEIRYEGYGIGGAAVMVDCMTDNRTRTVAEVRHALPRTAAISAPTARWRSSSSTAASSCSRPARPKTR